MYTERVVIDGKEYRSIKLAADSLNLNYKHLKHAFSTGCERYMNHRIEYKNDRWLDPDYKDPEPKILAKVDTAISNGYKIRSGSLLTVRISP
jgi:hypothetical protein